MKDDIEKPGPLPAATYALIYPRLCEIVRPLGYALAIHGSMTRDLDLVAIPWTEDAVTPDDVACAVCEYVKGYVGWDSNPGGNRPHGRRTWLIWFSGVRGPIGGGCHIDLSIMPRTVESAN